MPTLYTLKPRFQALLRPLVTGMARAGISANQVTILAAVISVIVGGIIIVSDSRQAFSLLPIWFLVRMGLNAVDGMLAREFGQKSTLGAYLNELGDVVADAALVAPFAIVAPFAPAWVFAVIFLGALSEYAGVMGPLAGAGRRYDGPFGKSDRALLFGALGLWIGIGGALPPWTAWIMPALTVLLAMTVINRVRNGVVEAASNKDVR
ncbi:CDP-alcohol phosphatidyltransferase family protein [Sphingomonas montana]|uniref:CDP-alcohol phosphatidyltransferase family protein n=1 Tax=Sphingomonas montana TaxID=1843236 RepID=UPI00096FC92C|nr:CDP-alcohol phosphatidyltransferase family protein [Sphingomonas montana]